MKGLSTLSGGTAQGRLHPKWRQKERQREAGTERLNSLFLSAFRPCARVPAFVNSETVSEC